MLPPAPEHAYTDYVLWQEQMLAGERGERLWEYWRKQLAGEPATLDLPLDRPRPPVQTYRGASHAFKLDAGLTARLREFAKAERATVYMTLLAAFQTLLHRHTSQDEILVGSLASGRSRAEFETIVGYFVNPLVMRAATGGNPTFREFLGEVRQTVLAALRRQDYPFPLLIERLQPARDASRSPLFQAMFLLQRLHRLDDHNVPTFVMGEAGARMEIAGHEVESYALPERVAQFELELIMVEADDALAGALRYNTDLFDAATAARMVERLRILIEGVLADPAQRLADLPLLTDDERRRLLVDWNDTRTVYAEGVCVQRLFEGQAARTPGAVAVAFEEEELTYGELNASANRLARRLRRLGVGPDRLVGIYAARSPRMLLAMLAVSKAGGAYLPLDPEYPRERLAFMLADARVKVVLTQERLVEKLPRGEAVVVRVDADWPRVARESAENTVAPTAADGVAYAVYTSGSTGQPKGSLIPHRAITRLVCDPNYVRLDASDVVAQASNASFDAATFEVWGALLNGARLVIIGRDVILSPTEFASELRGRGVTVLFLTTALFNLLARETPSCFGSLRQLLFGGEAVDAARVREVLEGAPPSRLLHVYGPTECTTFATWHLVREVPDGARAIPIGRPISKTQAFILDANLRPVPVGVHGELHVGGCGLAHGYLNRPGLTAERFIPHPFTGEAGARLYRTGDVARWRADGEIEFVGRADQQIKLRGFRVGLFKLDAVLVAHPLVRQCVVTLREDAPGEPRLVAYVVAEGDVSAAELRGHLRRRLPEFMVPAAFVALDALPLTPNGKLDRRALPPPDDSAVGAGASFAAPSGASFAVPSGASFVEPRDAVELQLARVWEELLGLGRVGVGDNFFDLGGHSLLAVRLMSHVRKLFGRDLPLAALFEGATVENLAALIRRGGASAWSPLVAVQPRGHKPPFFCVHPAGGNVICYAALARELGAARPFYGLQARGLDGRDEPFTRLEEMADYYVEAVRGVRPEGPYLLGGWSLGGAVAFEMARQLGERGQEVALLALLDSPAPHASRRGVEVDEAELLAGLGEDLGLHVSAEDLRGLTTDERLALFLEHGRARALVPSDYDLAQARRLLHVYETNIRAFGNYRPQPAATRIVLHRAGEAAGADSHGAPHPSAADPALGWGALSTAPVEVRRVPGDHVSMLSEPHVKALAAELGRLLEEASAATAGAARTTFDIKTQGA